MSKSADSPAVEKRSFAGEVEDFTQSALHAAIENPINGVIQIIDHTADVHLPQLEIIGAPTHDSIGSKMGAMVGAAADIVGLSIATGGVADVLGGTGLVAGIATAAATGAVWGGVLTPSDNNSKSFVTDRLENGAIGAAAFATMNGAAQALGATGYWAVPEARSLGGSLSFGALAGSAGGVATAETTALLKEHKAVPSAGELATDVASNAAFGAAMGGMNYAYNHIAGPAAHPTTIDSKIGNIKTINDAKGQPVAFEKIDTNQPDDLAYKVVSGTKMTDGSWDTVQHDQAIAFGPRGADEPGPDVTRVVTNANGSVSMTTDGKVSTYTQTTPESIKTDIAAPLYG